MFTDIRHALRLFLKNPVLYGVAIVTLAAGIGGNATIFSITHAFLYPELAFEAPEELVLLRTGDARTGQADGLLSLASYLALRDAVPSLQSLEALDRDSVRWAAGDGAAEQLSAARTTAGFFTTLGVSAERGRVLATGEDRPGAQPVVLLTHGLWQRRFGSDQAIVGRSLELDGTAHTVIGVLAENFEYFDSSFEVFLPLHVEEAGTADWTTTVSAIGRLDAGASAAQMEREVAAVGARLAEKSPEHMRQRVLLGETVPDAFPGRTDQMLVKILMTGVGFVLLIACANIANLLLARGEARRTEIATRAALGAGSGRLARQLVTESLLLALLGGVAGVGVAVGGVRFLQASMPPDMPRGFVPELDLAVLLFTFAATLGCGLLFGAIQVFFVSRGQLADELREGARGTGSRKRGWLRNSLVVSQMAFAAILLVGTSVMATAFMEHMLVDTGIDETGKLTVALERPKDEEPAAGAAFFRRVLDELGRTPGVRSAAAANVLPRDRAVRTAPFTIEGIATAAGEEPSAITTTITPGYLESLGIGTAAGRQLWATDRGDSRPVVVVNRAFVAEFLSEVPDVLGTRLKLGIATPGEAEGLVAREIVGVVDDFYQLRLNPGDGPSPQVFVPLEQAPVPAMTLMILTEGDPLTFAGTVREAVWKVSPEQTIGQVATLAAHIDEMTKGPQTITRIIAGLSALALGLAALGLYGVLSYSVSMRRREIGVRMALGASRRSVVGLVAGQGLRLIVIGALFAVPGVWAVLKVLTSAFDGIAVLDLAGASLTVGLLFAVGLISCLLPARLAARVLPTETLR